MLCCFVCVVLCCAVQNALVPVLVRGLLSNHSAERLAAGMSHVAVVATQRTKATNSNSGSASVTRLLTWGKNTAGQLGIGAGREDHHMPQVGGTHTAVQRRSSCFGCGMKHVQRMHIHFVTCYAADAVAAGQAARVRVGAAARRQNPCGRLARTAEALNVTDCIALFCFLVLRLWLCCHRLCLLSLGAASCS